MFISNLNREQQGILLGLARKIMSADGREDDKEQKKIEVIRAQCDPNVDTTKLEMQDLHGHFRSRKEKVSLLMEMSGVAYSDGECHESEKRILEETARSLEAPDQLLENINIWVANQFVLTRQAEIMMEGE